MKTTTYLRLTSLPIPRFIKNYLEKNFWVWASGQDKKSIAARRKWREEWAKEDELETSQKPQEEDEYPMVDTELKNGIFLEEVGEHPERITLAKDKIPKREMNFWADDCLRLGG